MAPPHVKVTMDYANKISKAVNRLSRQRVFVGITSKAAPRPGDPLNNAAIAYIHEFGSPLQRIPPRPFLLPGARLALPKVIPYLRLAAQAAIMGKDKDTLKILNMVGIIVQASVRQKIVDGPFTPLAPVTIARRQAKGQLPPYKPLIDTGQMRQAVTYRIGRK